MKEGSGFGQCLRKISWILIRNTEFHLYYVNNDQGKAKAAFTVKTDPNSDISGSQKMHGTQTILPRSSSRNMLRLGQDYIKQIVDQIVSESGSVWNVDPY